MNARIRRVLVTTDAVGGVWTYTIDLADALRRRGVDVVLAVLGPAPSGEQLAEARAAGVGECRHVGDALEWMDDPWDELERAGGRLLGLEQEVRPDVVHLGSFGLASLGWSAPTVVVAHSDVLSWWRWVHDEPAPPQWAEYARRVSAGLHDAGAVVAPTAAVAENLAASYGFQGARVIHNGRRADWVIPAPKEPLVLCAGRTWDRAKNVAELVGIAERLTWPVVIAGDDDPTPGAVHRLGRLPFAELAPWLARAAVYAAPARYEPFGLAVLEAALSGCALVLGDIPSLREVWGDAAQYVRPGDDAALARTLHRLTHDLDAAQRWGARARARAARYGIDAMADAYLALYARLPERVGGGR